jgi:hypothetical protein
LGHSIYSEQNGNSNHCSEYYYRFVYSANFAHFRGYSATDKHLLNRLPIYNGNNTLLPFAVWRGDFENIMECNNISDDRIMMYLRQALSGQPRVAVNQLPEVHRQDWHYAIDHIEHLFGYEESSVEKCRTYHERRQRASETPREFAMQLQTLFQTAYPDYPIRKCEQFVIPAFLAGLTNQKIKDKVERYFRRHTDKRLTQIINEVDE